jgi:hypothetical protein
MLIRTYGLFWRREWIFWGRGNAAGHLRGVPAASRTSDPTDFREQQGIYCLYDDNFRLVYVGQAGANDQHRLFGRLRNHRTDQLSDRWTKFSWFGTRAVNNDGSLRVEAKAAHPTIGEVLDHIEAIVISVSEPPHNRQGGKFGENVIQYLQYRDIDNLGPDLDSMVRDLWKQKQLS